MISFEHSKRSEKKNLREVFEAEKKLYPVVERYRDFPEGVLYALKKLDRKPDINRFGMCLQIS